MEKIFPAKPISEVIQALNPIKTLGKK